MEIGDLQPVQSMDIQVDQYEGMRVEVDKLEIVEVLSNYNEQGVFVDGLKRPVKRLKVSTKPLEVISNPGKEPFELRASMIFGLKEMKDKDGKTTWGYSTGKNGKLAKFMKLLKVNTIQEIKGKLVTVLTRPSQDGSRSFLGFKIE